MPGFVKGYATLQCKMVLWARGQNLDFDSRSSTEMLTLIAIVQPKSQLYCPSWFFKELEGSYHPLPFCLRVCLHLGICYPLTWIEEILKYQGLIWQYPYKYFHMCIFFNIPHSNLVNVNIYWLILGQDLFPTKACENSDT